MGIEDSCEISAWEMDAATMKLYALADIVIKLMGKCHSTHKWPVEIENLPDQLRKRPLREILQVIGPLLFNLSRPMSQTTPFQQRPSPEELKSLINLTNKIVYHRIETHSHRI